MKKFLLYNDVVNHAGIGHTLWSYNVAFHVAIQHNLQLIVPRIKMGHGLGDDFRFEKFFGLDIHDEEFINKMDLKETIEIQRTDVFHPKASNLLYTKYLFQKKYFDTIQYKINKYQSHNIRDKKIISIHIRRGDYIRNEETRERYKDWLLPDSWFRSALDYALNENGLNLDDVHVNIYSELHSDGLYHNENLEIANLKDIFNFENCTLYLSTEGLEMFYNMVESDIFIGGTCRGLALAVPLFRHAMGRMSYCHQSCNSHFNKNKYSHSIAIPNRLLIDKS